MDRFRVESPCGRDAAQFVMWRQSRDRPAFSGVSFGRELRRSISIWLLRRPDLSTWLGGEASWLRCCLSEMTMLPFKLVFLTVLCLTLLSGGSCNVARRNRPVLPRRPKEGS
mgnify:CR=1 FL=1